MAIAAAPTVVTPENKLLEESGVRLYITTVTGTNFTWRAQMLQRAILPSLGPRDVFSHTCEDSCVYSDHGLVGNMVVIPEMPDGILNLKIGVIKCAHAHGYCGPSHVAQAKFPFGIIHEVRRMKASGNPMPQWWMVRDDDTYVHVEHLMGAIEAYGENRQLPKPLHEQLICFTPPCGLGICGGGGWVLSAAFAEMLVGQIGDKWMQFQANRVRKGMPHYDLHVKKALTWLSGWRLINLPHMNAFAPNSELCDWKPGGNDGRKCINTSVCACATAEVPSSWHLNLLRPDIEKMLDLLQRNGM